MERLLNRSWRGATAILHLCSTTSYIVRRRRTRSSNRHQSIKELCCCALWRELPPRALSLNNARALSGGGKRTAASGVAWSGCASLRGALCAGEALLEARTQASVALFKLGAHSATLRPEFGGQPKSLRCCCAKGVGHRLEGELERTTTLSRYCVHQHHKSSLSPVSSLTQGGHNYRVPRLAATLPTESGSPPAPQGGWPRLKSCRSRRAR